MSPSFHTSSSTTTFTTPSHPDHQSLTPSIMSTPYRCSTFPRHSNASNHKLSDYPASTTPPPSVNPHTTPTSCQAWPHTTVRDFAYSSSHPMHYGPPLESDHPPSGRSSPISDEAQDLSDPVPLWDVRDKWKKWPYEERLRKDDQLAPIHFGDGPPWSEDEDLQSPVVVSSRHRKHRSPNSPYSTRRRSRRETTDNVTNSSNHSKFDNERRIFLAPSDEGNKHYYKNQGNEDSNTGNESNAHPSESTRNNTNTAYNVPGQRDSHFAGILPSRSYTDNAIHDSSESDNSSVASSPSYARQNESRYSRDYQFTIASSDEEMHGKAVALFDFTSENENELPLIEGQVIWVSYRHGQGWLVAEDPKTRESGLVPEEYVRLLRYINGGLSSVSGNLEEPVSPLSVSRKSARSSLGQAIGQASNGTGYQQPIVSTFSTSSKDLNPYPQHLLGTQAGQTPPQVMHYCGHRGSQATTPTVTNSLGSIVDRENSLRRRKSEGSIHLIPSLAYLPISNLEPSTAVRNPGISTKDPWDSKYDANPDSIHHQHTNNFKQLER
ncbi:BgTH12-00730 [Blumeria graminis f. sp. triticale]|uniref:Bgt-4970 n=3 Tax=Blumeria graminis TaxID=34373 RepID=A0A9X9MNJ9_BLUGR|nr:hypothetical protein BGT96224_4970 [Blumeria graminis f. sp. tritici 96224]CAD6505238.1 BgTH12-00730 [Blumeria graminis f. sp. triticale]VDB93250.1 Bgt-4970 [Blumeria graminis f. sp. tritici]